MKLEDFPLSWRWTDSRHSALPKAVLAQLQPMPKKKAREAFEQTRQFSKLAGITQPADVSDEEGSRWLRAQQVEPTESITISWSPDCALRTRWTVFADHWSDFCYPSSDDLVVWPDSKRWVLFYDHDEVFRFAPNA